MFHLNNSYITSGDSDTKLLYLDVSYISVEKSISLTFLSNPHAFLVFMEQKLW
jgi:hypothetical protein